MRIEISCKQGATYKAYCSMGNSSNRSILPHLFLTEAIARSKTTALNLDQKHPTTTCANLHLLIIPHHHNWYQIALVPISPPCRSQSPWKTSPSAWRTWPQPSPRHTRMCRRPSPNRVTTSSSCLPLWPAWIRLLWARAPTRRMSLAATTRRAASV